MFQLRAVPRPHLRRSFLLDPDRAHEAARSHIDAIQHYAQKKVTPDLVHVRGMYLTNTQRDYHYSRFAKVALDEQVEMIPGAPVMTGHNYSLKPDARYFDAQVVQLADPELLKSEQFWTECLYYVPKDATGDEYVNRVDLGIYREVSIGFRCASAPCSVCSRPIWRCAHMPGEIYAGKGVCEYGMEAMTGVLEGSQVFRGGQKDTSNFIPAGERGRYRSALYEGDVDCRDLHAAKHMNVVDEVEPFGLTVEEFLATDEARRAIDRGCSFGKRGERSNTQLLALSKSRFSPARARRWVRDHDFRVDKPIDSASEYRFEQFAASEMEAGSITPMLLEEGVVAQIGRMREADDASGRSAVDIGSQRGESTDQWLARTAG